MEMLSPKNGILVMVFIAFFGCKQDHPRFTSIPSQQSKIYFENNLVETEDFNINEYLYAYNGGGVAVGDFNNDGLVDIYFTSNQQGNRLYLNKGDFVFEDVTDLAGDVGGPVGKDYWTTGATVIDINNDGWLDIYVNMVSNLKNLKGHNQLYINNGDGTFSEKSKDFGLDLAVFGQQSVFFDYDLDGDLDMYQLNHSVHELGTYIKAENRVFRDSLAGDRLYRNDNNVFVDVSEEANIYGGAMGYGLSVSVSDLNNDGCPDIYVSNDFHENDFVYFNQCDGTFKEAITSVMGQTSTFSMGSDIADLNNDGRMDVFTLDMKPESEEIKKRSAGSESFQIYEYKRSYGYHHQYPRNMLQINRGNLDNEMAYFSEVAELCGLEATDWSWSVLIADFDNDMLNDIYITNGILRRPNDLDYINYTYNKAVRDGMNSLESVKLMPSGIAKNYAFRNNDNLSFQNVSKSWGLDLEGYSMGSAYADLDNDGDLDLIVNNLNQPSTIYRNNSEKIENNSYLKIALLGGSDNRNGIGAKVELLVNERILVQELYPVRGWLSSSDFILNFGLGDAKEIEKLKVTWGDGNVQELHKIKINQRLELNYKDAIPSEPKNRGVKPLFKSVAPEFFGITFEHQENNYSDFNSERLIPHKLSTEGPKLAVGDVNGDGLEDFFVGGAAGQPASLYIQKKGISDNRYYFESIGIDIFKDDQAFEDSDAVFFDVDNDGDLDLYVVSGGGEVDQYRKNEDRLYLNLGEGNFVKSNNLPKLNRNGSCAVAADFNDDGYIDLFLGSRSIPGSYGLSPDSHILWNTGKGTFELDKTAYAKNLSQLGMVTDAVWDKVQKELIVVGEWMPITVLKFAKGGIDKSEIPNSTGWWNTVCSIDINNDGYTDYLLGNVGLNSILKPSIEEPVRLLIKDWDNNGSIDPLLTYYRHGNEWLFDGFDELKEQMPSIKNRFKNYSFFSTQSLNTIFSKNDVDEAIVKSAVTFSSGILFAEKDKYRFQDLPLGMQFSPVYSFLTGDFTSNNHVDIIAAGNFYGNRPSIGKFDGGYGNLAQGIGNDNFENLDLEEMGLFIPGETRDLKQIKIGDSDFIIASMNNKGIKLFQIGH